MGDPALLWDLAGTLIPYDPDSGRPGVLPGCEDFLPEIGRDFRMFVATGDSGRTARGQLQGHGLLDHFEDVFGDLLAAVGKPFGAILQHVGGDPERSLAVGDRLRVDVAADTDRLVSVLINQDRTVANCGMIAFLIHRLRERADTFPDAFDKLLAEAVPDPAREGEAEGGEIVTARRDEHGLPCRLWVYRHALLEGDRRVIVV